MAEKTFLLVAEGPTDIIIFQAIAEHLSSEQVSINIQSLAPQKDATSNGYHPHGFGEVKNWCLANKDKIQTLIDFSDASGLLIQMDTDIALQINKDCTKIPRQCCADKLNEAFSSLQEPDHCHYILPTQNTEIWLLASHDNYTALDSSLQEITDFELFSDTDGRLGDLGYPGKKIRTGRKKLSKNPSKYLVYGQRLVNNLPLARTRCQELHRLCDILTQS